MHNIIIHILTILTSFLAISCTALATKAPSLELKYFNAKGVAETSRLLLAIAEQSYKDTRFDITPGTFDAPAFTAAKESGELKMNMNRAPVLVIDGQTTIGQSKTIERYLAKRFGLMGDGSDAEEATVDCITEHCRDVRDAAARKGFSAFVRNKTEEEKAVLRKEWYETDLPALLLKLEESVAETSGQRGFAVAGKLSYADVAIFTLLRDCGKADLEDTAKAAEACVLLNSIADAVGGDPRVVKWLDERPETMF
eukprot:CAMPEP_0172512132 /NCGR_PEP_ID=MMETSP1066-20121228/241922_1 /TAXON_ID=671091 /ORGANISM="Coscinodiscus wailesii, Strain CCMP2513" /LENGTH=253 /DNA_ID=CAMNT_0013291789 /DNA_START=28 /DNA_END=789 /DNA_ORIENTATION=+